MATQITLREALGQFLEHLKAAGKKERTLYTYARDADVIVGFFGQARKLATLRAADVGRFLKSDALLKMPTGKDRAERTVAKTVRVLRMCLEWAKAEGMIASLPFPKDAMPKRPRQVVG